MKRRPSLRVGGTRWLAGLALAGLALAGLAACYESHEPETGVPVTVLTAELNILQLPVAEPEPAVGALVRAERCVDGAVVEAKVKADGRAWIDFGDGVELDCWTVTVVSLEGRPTALTLIRERAPLPAPVVLDRTRGPSLPRTLPTLATLEVSIGTRSSPESGVTIHGHRVDVEGESGFNPIRGDAFGVEVPREDLLAEETLFAIEWHGGVPINATRFPLGPLEDDVVRATVDFPSPPTPIHRERLPMRLPVTGAIQFGTWLFDEGWFWGTGGWVRGVRADGGTSRVGQLIFEYDEAHDPPWSFEAVWPDLPWTEIFAHEPWMSFVFVRSSEEDDRTHGFVDGPIEQGENLVVPPVERASIDGVLPREISVEVGGEGHVGFLWLQGGDDAFLEYARYRIYSAPDEPLVLEAWPTLPGGLTVEDLGLDGEQAIRATIGVSDPHGNPGWMQRPVSEQRGRRLFVGFLKEPTAGSF